MPGFPYEWNEVEFRPGWALLIYSDGFSEALNRRLEEFGDDRLRKSAENHASLPPDELVKTLLTEVSGFCGDAPQADDMTMMAIRRYAE